MENTIRYPISGAMLAGGENKRFPVLKGFLKLNGVTVIEKNLKLLDSLCDDVLISTNTPEFYFGHQRIMLGDILPSRGPMSGIHSALLNSGNENLFVTACDMPFLNNEILSFICKRHFELYRDIQYDATIPVYNGKAQPLCGIYRKSVLLSLERHILEQKNSMYMFLRQINTNFINEAEIKKIDPDGDSFVNINTIDDYEMFKRREGEFVLTI